MAKTSSKDKIKGGSQKKPASKKLEFLLDTIDTEVANLADVVDIPGPILDDLTPAVKKEAVSRHNKESAMDSLELDLDLAGDLNEAPAGKESGGSEALAALDAMSDAEGEVEAILAQSKEAKDAGGDAAPTAGKEPVDQDIAKALEELLATREVDASKLLKKTPPLKKQPAVRPPAVEDQFAEDLFDDLDTNFASEEIDSVNDDPGGSETDLEKDLLQELTDDFASETFDSGGSCSATVDKEIDENFLERAAARGDGAGGDATKAVTARGGDEQLAELFSKKIEALVSRLVEERLSDIAERVVNEKINKIFSSMK